MAVWSTLLAGKTAARISRVTGRGGGQALPGLVAERLDKNLLAKIAGRFSQGVILVTGTNGKTTTVKLLTSMLEKKGWRVLTNSTGSNLKRGIVSAVIDKAHINGRLNYDVAVFEVDEASLRRVAGLLKPRYIVVLNLFRDQLDRYGELDTTAALIGEGIGQTEATLCLNADDPLVANLAKYAVDPQSTVYFGVGDTVDHRPSLITATDSDRCPICHEVLVFPRIWFGHIGHYRCPKCHYKRPMPDVEVTSISDMTTRSSRLKIKLFDHQVKVQYQLPGIYNVYNAVAAAAVAARYGVTMSTIERAMSESVPAFGRVERVAYRGLRR
jgi:UDP-N-acetylmuramyl tripeptide synthase